MAQEQIDKAIFEQAKKIDELYYQLADIQDVKTSVFMAVAALSGTLSIEILKVPDLPNTIKYLQALGGAALVAFVVLGVISLWPRDFKVPPHPKKWVEECNSLEEKYKQRTEAAKLILADFEAELLRTTIARIDNNKSTTDFKATLSVWAVSAITVAITIQLVSLLWLALWHV